jgi:very-short-patch-repair endonuclease
MQVGVPSSRIPRHTHLALLLLHSESGSWIWVVGPRDEIVARAPHPLRRVTALARSHRNHPRRATSPASTRGRKLPSTREGGAHFRMRTRFAAGLLHGTLLRHSRELRKDATDAERWLWAHLRKKNLEGARFRRQYPIEGFIVDFCCIRGRLIVEVDGSQHVENIPYDDQRTRIIELQGFHVLRFWNGDVMQNVDGVVEMIFETLRGASPDTPTCAASVSQEKSEPDAALPPPRIRGGG